MSKFDQSKCIFSNFSTMRATYFVIRATETGRCPIAKSVECFFVARLGIYIWGSKISTQKSEVPMTFIGYWTLSIYRHFFIFPLLLQLGESVQRFCQGFRTIQNARSPKLSRPPEP